MTSLRIALIYVGLILGVIGLIAADYFYRTRLNRLIEAVRTAENPIRWLGMNSLYRVRAELHLLTGEPRQLRSVVCGLPEDALTIYHYDTEPRLLLRARYDQIRWFGRPKPYSYGINEIWFHLETDDGWMLLKLWADRWEIAGMVRFIKPRVTPNLYTAYRRRRPYIHAGPVSAQPATQDIHGAWSLAEPIRLYLMPRLLLLLNDATISRRIPLEQINQVGALQRLDAPEANGLVRFLVGDEVLAFALPDHVTFANQLAEAARLNLEAPILPKQKGKKDDEDDDEE